MNQGFGDIHPAVHPSIPKPQATNEHYTEKSVHAVTFIGAVTIFAIQGHMFNEIYSPKITGANDTQQQDVIPLEYVGKY